MIAAARTLALVLVGAAVIAGCGSSTPKVPTGGTALPRLAKPPAVVPADYTTLAALERQLAGVARCSGNGPQSAVCSLEVTTTNSGQIASIRPFEVKVFRSTAAAQQYVALVTATNSTRTATGSPLRTLLAGPHWVAVPQTTTADLDKQLKPYLGGTIRS